MNKSVQSEVGIPHSRPTLRKEEMRSTLECMVSDAIAPGKQVGAFEEQLAKYLKVPVLRASSSGTTAFFLILKLLGVEAGDEIILPSYAPSVLLNPIYYLKAKPILVDVNPVDYSLLLDDLRNKISTKTRAILLVHLFGIPQNVSAYKEFEIPVIENCAQALGSLYEEQKCGTMGDYAFFSFYASKMITTGGTGGALVSTRQEDAEKLEALLRFEPSDTFHVSYPFYMSDLQAAMGGVQLSQIDDFIGVREKIANYYTSQLKKANKTVSPSFINRKQVYYRYLIQPEMELDEAVHFFDQYQIEVKRPIYKPLHHYLGLSPKEYPNTEEVYHKTLSLPIYPTLKKSEVELISKIASKV